ncbi:MAG TPA: DUF4389 domain-containing protein [Polyangia bacterium]|nr:DUF4389 domain-containing protein [Polyangia bacterium]
MRHAVHLSIEPEGRPRRIHVVLRLVLMLALGVIHFDRVYGVAYLAVPALVALAIGSRGAGRYVAEDGPRLARLLRWIAAAGAYLSLLTDVPPTLAPGHVELVIEPRGAPTVGSALLRLVTSLPALVLVALLSLVASFCWLVGAACILVAERLPGALRTFLTLTLRTQLRLVAYHLSIVEDYPSLADEPVAQAHG